jgi:hypothetical protein
MAEEDYYQNFLKTDLDMWFERFNSAGESLRNEWFNPRYNNEAVLAKRKWDAAQEYQLIKKGSNPEDWKKRQKKTAELESGMMPRAASTLFGLNQQPETNTLASKVLFGR